jgi:hypothetical protein
MEPRDILARLDEPHASYQWEAMDAAVEQQAALTPLLLQRLESAAAAPETVRDTQGAGLLYTMVLLAHFRETAAHEVLVRLASWPEDVINDVLGDAVNELLPAVLWRTSGGETGGLCRLLEKQSAHGFCRGAAAEALAWGALFDDLDQDTIETYFLELLHDETFAEAGDPAWFCLFHALLDLHPQAHEDRLREWIRSTQQIGLHETPESDLDWILSMPREQALAQAREEATWRLPHDVHGYLSHWAGLQPGFWDDASSRTDPFEGEAWPAPGRPPLPGAAGPARATKPKGADPGTKKRKRKQQKKARKANRKRK